MISSSTGPGVGSRCFINMIGSFISLANVFLLPLDHPIRVIVSGITVAASLLQILWLYSGTREIARTRKIDPKNLQIISFSILPITVLLVFLYFDNPDAGDYRIFFRVSVKSLFGGIIFIVRAAMLWQIAKTGIGIRLIIFSFVVYGLLQPELLR